MRVRYGGSRRENIFRVADSSGYLFIMGRKQARINDNNNSSDTLLEKQRTSNGMESALASKFDQYLDEIQINLELDDFRSIGTATMCGDGKDSDVVVTTSSLCNRDTDNFIVVNNCDSNSDTDRFFSVGTAMLCNVEQDSDVVVTTSSLCNLNADNFNGVNCCDSNTNAGSLRKCTSDDYDNLDNHSHHFVEDLVQYLYPGDIVEYRPMAVNHASTRSGIARATICEIDLEEVEVKLQDLTVLTMIDSCRRLGSMNADGEVIDNPSQWLGVQEFSLCSNSLFQSYVPPNRSFWFAKDMKRKLEHFRDHALKLCDSIGVPSDIVLIRNSNSPSHLVDSTNEASPTSFEHHSKMKKKAI